MALKLNLPQEARDLHAVHLREGGGRQGEGRGKGEERGGEREGGKREGD